METNGLALLTYPLDLPTKLMDEVSAFSNCTAELPNSLPNTVFFGSALSDMAAAGSTASNVFTTRPRIFLSANWNTIGWPTVNASPANCIRNSLAIKSVSYGSWVVLQCERKESEYVEVPRSWARSFLLFFLQEVHLHDDIAQAFSCTGWIEAIRLHIEVLVDRQRRPFSLQQRESNGSLRHLRCPMDRKYEMLSGSGWHFDIADNGKRAKESS